jgi:ribose-phosphate pyrophosphokinase
VETGTTELALPGLEIPPEPQRQPSGERGRWIERGPSGKLMLFSGRSNPVLAGKIADQLNIELGDVQLETFANGETYCRYRESIRGADVFIVQSCYGRPTNDYLWELLTMIQAAKLASANRITAVVPWYPYSRQDKKSSPREPITAKLLADVLEAAGVDRVLTMDLHAGQIQGFFRIPVDHMVAVPMFAQHIRDYLGSEVERVAVAPDTGRAKLAGKFAEMIGGGLVVLNKERPGHNQARVTGVIGDVAGKVAVMTDDILDTAGTLCAGAEALREAGATKVYACATHALFNDPAFERIADSAFERVIVTDTVPVDPLRQPDNVEVLSISGLLAETIGNVFADDSVSAIFAGENQLF